MIIYWDLVVITNLVVDYAFLKTIAIIFNEKIKIMRLLLSLLLGSISLFLFLIPIKYLYNLRYVIGIIMGMITYNSKKPQKRLLMIISFYIINLVFVGSLVIFEIQNIFFLLMTMIYTIVLTMIEKVLNKKIKKEIEYIVKMDNINLIGLLDTGNTCYYLNKPVVFIKEEYLSKEFIYIGDLEIEVINSKQKVKIYRGPKILINDRQYEVYYSFANIDQYDIILNNSMEG